MAFRNAKFIQQAVLFGILVFLCVVMTIISSDFFTYVNITNIMRQNSMVAIVAVGATFVMLTGGLDISVGSNLALTGVVFAISCQAGIPIFPSTIIAVLAGTAVGAVNGALIVGIKMNHVIATLGTMYAVRGVAFIIADGSAIVTGLPENFLNMGRGFIFEVMPIPVVIMVIVYFIFHIILSRTLFGKYIYAIGGNIETARLSGIPVRKIRYLAYLLIGSLTGLAGVIMASRLNSGNPQIGQGFEFDVIIAVFLGGLSTKGGEGSLIGTLIGTMIIGVLSNGLNILGVNAFYQYIIKGAVLVLAVTVDMTLREKRFGTKKLS